jgi:hypothetical protein
MANPMFARDQQKRPLAACLALALAAAGACIASDAEATTFTVTNCSDSGAGSLRAIIAAGTTHSGDTVNFSAQLVCSTITLTSGQILITQNDLTINGPGAETLAIDGNFTSRVLTHLGTGTLTISDLTITHGKYDNTVPYTVSQGGCVYSRSTLALVNSTVSSCIAKGGSAAGGGIWAENLSLTNSRVVYNNASGPSSTTTYIGVRGGGISAVSLQAVYSTIAYNGASTPDGHGRGGGLYTYGNAQVQHTTISSNRANIAGGWDSISNSPAAITIADSTISGNCATNENGGMRATVPLTISNSTIAFNQATEKFAGLSAGATLTLQSSIIADNITVYNGASDDLDGFPATITISSSNNLITSTTLTVPLDTITACPKLGPLADNGGSTLTHALAHDSPAINHANIAMFPPFDQRGAGYPRPFGAAPDIGAYEWQGTPDDRLFVSRFESACDS